VRFVDLSAPIVTDAAPDFLRTEVELAGHAEGARQIQALFGVPPELLRDGEGWAVETLKQGAELAGKRGLILGVEDDGGITEFAKETIAIVKGADSPWAGMNLDIGNFRPPAVYDQIEQSIPYAVSTHVKTEVANDNGKTRDPFDWDRVFKMFAAHGFRGYMGLEYETSGDAAGEIPGYLRKLKELAVKYSG